MTKRVRAKYVVWSQLLRAMPKSVCPNVSVPNVSVRAASERLHCLHEPQINSLSVPPNRQSRPRFPLSSRLISDQNASVPNPTCLQFTSLFAHQGEVAVLVRNVVVVIAWQV